MLRLRYYDVSAWIIDIIVKKGNVGLCLLLDCLSWLSNGTATADAMDIRTAAVTSFIDSRANEDSPRYSPTHSGMYGGREVRPIGVVDLYKTEH